MAKNHNCEQCKFRKKYDDKPTSLLGRIWRWHIGWCPGWSKYYSSLEAKEQERLDFLYTLNRKK
jgi:hypothetical protein